MSQDLSALTTAHGPREVEWLGTRLLLRAFLLALLPCCARNQLKPYTIGIELEGGFRSHTFQQNGRFAFVAHLRRQPLVLISIYRLFLPESLIDQASSSYPITGEERSPFRSN
ncbi:hypothetical protein VNO80_26891 [Phaseolus coccineus]|uniref:Uncharacterized protein n=1 Tax=Phaseolus coccineus TaxID=3886 RepID=A0AAN9QKX0_PHACN